MEELARVINNANFNDIGLFSNDDWQPWLPEARATLPIIAREVEKARAEERDKQAKQIEVLQAAVTEAELLFRSYEQMHLTKGTADGDEKAYRNKQAADKMRAAIDASALHAGNGGEG